MRWSYEQQYRVVPVHEGVLQSEQQAVLFSFRTHIGMVVANHAEEKPITPPHATPSHSQKRNLLQTRKHHTSSDKGG